MKITIVKNYCSTLFVLFSVSFLIGCANSPTTIVRLPAPTLPEKTTWSYTPDNKTQNTEVLGIPWWEGFGDPALNDLVVAALNHGPTIEILQQRILLARIGLNLESARQWPQISTSLSAEKQKTQGFPSTSFFSQQSRISWELDIWGKAKQGNLAQQALYQASHADWYAAKLSLAANIVNQYINILLLDSQIEKLQFSLAKSKTILSGYEAQFREALISGSQIRSQRAEFKGLKFELIELQRNRKLIEHALATLLGKPAGQLAITNNSSLQSLNTIDVPLDLPAALLNRRPDLIAAKYRLKNTSHRHKQALSERFPSISLTGSAGSSTGALNKLLKIWTFGIGPSINIPILDQSIRPRIQQRATEYDIAAIEYRRIVLQAFQEVEDSLVNLHFRKRQTNELQEQRDDLRIVSKHTFIRLQEGMVSQLEVFESERALLSAERRLLNNHAQILQETVALIRALGGGWHKQLLQLDHQG